MLVECLNCNKEFDKKPCHIRRSPNHYCSRSCAAKTNNKNFPKRSVEGHCKQCQAPISKAKRFCNRECRKLFFPGESLEDYRERIKKNVIAFRQRQKLKALEYKGSCCQICGYNRCVRSLVFHHLNEFEKEFGISTGATRSWKKVKIELDKCVLLCQNCHGEVHAGMHPEYQ